MTPVDVIILGGLGGAVGGLIGLALGGSGKRRRKRDKRLDKFKDRLKGKTAEKADDAAASLKKDDTKERAWAEFCLRLTPKPENLRTLLAQTGKKLSITQFFLFCVATTVFVSIILRVFAGLPVPVAGLVGISVGPALVVLALRYIAGKRADLFINQFPDAIDLMVRGIKSGLPIGEALASIGREFSGPVGEEFSRVTENVRVGTSLQDALAKAILRVPVQELKFFAISLSIQQDTGGNLAETLENLSDILRRRKQMKLKIKAMSSEARASSYILGSLPFLMFAILLVINRDYVLTLVYEPRGQTLMAIGLGMIGIGVAVMYRMVQFRI